jgi:GTP cyclohydrolase II
MITLQAMPPVSIRNQVPIQVRNGKYAGQFYTFHGLPDGKEHIAIAFGEAPGRTPLVRVHSECLTGDIFGSQLCDCGQQLSEAMDRLTEDGGYLIYLRQEGRGIGLYAKLDSYKLQHEGLDTFEANHRLNFPSDLRDYQVAALMLQALGCTNVRLLSNNPDKATQLERYGVRIAERVRTGLFATPHNLRYLRAKAQKAHHVLDGIPLGDF